jgi:hypothetical protein
MHPVTYENVMMLFLPKKIQISSVKVQPLFYFLKNQLKSKPWVPISLYHGKVGLGRHQNCSETCPVPQGAHRSSEVSSHTSRQYSPLWGPQSLCWEYIIQARQNSDRERYPGMNVHSECKPGLFNVTDCSPWHWYYQLKTRATPLPSYRWVTQTAPPLGRPGYDHLGLLCETEMCQHSIPIIKCQRWSNYKKGKVCVGFRGFSLWSVGPIVLGPVSRQDIMVGICDRRSCLPHGGRKWKREERAGPHFLLQEHSSNDRKTSH